MGGIFFLLWIASVIGGWVLAANRHGNGIGCLWAVLLFILGPLAPFVLLLYWLLGNDKER